MQPSHPIYIPSKGRANKQDTARCFDKDGVNYRVVVEPQEADDYANVVGRDRLLVLPKSNQGIVYVRNWIKQHSIGEGHAWHWQIDDDILMFGRRYKHERMYCNAGDAMKLCEGFVDRYENVKLFSLNHIGFIGQAVRIPPFYRNTRCYTAVCHSNDLPCEYRGPFNDDTDMTLQVLARGFCTIMFNAFFMQTGDTVDGGTDRKASGGMTGLYHDDGRLQMARCLERRWPHVVEVRRKFGRPQHFIKYNWKHFDTPLKLKDGVDLSEMPKVDEKNLTMVRKSESDCEHMNSTFDAYHDRYSR